MVNLNRISLGYCSAQDVSRILDTLHSILLIQGLYTYVISDYGDPRNLATPTWFVSLNTWNGHVFQSRNTRL